MPDLTSPDQRRHLVIWGLSLVVLVAASTWTALGNQWVQDDIFIIFSNEAVHSLAAPWRFFATAYWPEPFPPDLYRPVTMLLFACQWAIGDGAPVVFRITSILLYLGSTLACWGLARRLLPPAAAWCTAALFAVHPVHVEAVAVAVNQSELIVALVLIVAVTKWIDRRRAGLLVTGTWGVGLALVWFATILVKEHAVVLPALLVAAELTVLRRPEITRLTAAVWARLALTSLLTVAVAITIRTAVLPDAKGSFTAEALQELTVGGRALTMLSVVPEWLRLLAWPQYLQSDYSPQEILPATSFGQAQLAGTLLLVLAGLLITMTWRKLPVTTFGVLWLAISLGPVHNVLVATGIVLAERTLFLGSAGFLIGAVGLISAGRAAIPGHPRQTSIILGGGLATLLALGISRSASRQRVWHDLDTFTRQSVIDAPLSYRVHHGMAQYWYRLGKLGMAEQSYRRSIALYPKSWTVRLDLANRYRLNSKCWPAITEYRNVLAINPLHTGARASLVACLLFLGDYATARSEAELGIPLEHKTDNFRKYVVTADSALAAEAPAGTVRLPPPQPTDRVAP